MSRDPRQRDSNSHKAHGKTATILPLTDRRAIKALAIPMFVTITILTKEGLPKDKHRHTLRAIS